MPAGRPPLPTDLKILRGNPGKRRLDVADEPQPRPGVPEPPDHLDDAGREQWFRWCTELSAMKVLTLADREALAVMCDTWSRYLKAEAAVKKFGLLTKSPNGYPIQNPALAIATQAGKQLRQMMSEFGLTPAARTRIKTTDPSQPDLPGFDAPPESPLEKAARGA